MRPMETSDERIPNETITFETVATAAGGDRCELRRIYELTSDRVFQLMIRMVGQQDAEDLTQQTYVKAFTKIGQFSGESKFETWLYRLATNEALQHLRREKHRRMRELAADPASRETDQVEQEERVAMVRNALDQLDPELRAIFTLREGNGLSYQDLAATLNIPEGTVASRLNRARRELKTILEGRRE